MTTAETNAVAFVEGLRKRNRLQAPICFCEWEGARGHWMSCWSRKLPHYMWAFKSDGCTLEEFRLAVLTEMEKQKA